MIATLVLMILALMIFGALSFQQFDSNRTQTLYTQSVQYVSDLQMVKQMLLALSTTYEVTDDEGTRRYPALPLGQNIGGIHTLPSLMMKQQNPLKKPYVYCPSAARSDQPMTVTINDIPNSYAVATSTLVKNGKSMEYVTSSGLNTVNGAVILAFIISPNPLYGGSVSCGDVEYDEASQKFNVPGGRAETITALEVEAVNLSKTSEN